MTDRFLRGVAAGVIAYAPTWLYNYVAYSFFHFPKYRFADFASVMILGIPARGSIELWFARLVTLFFLALCGAVFAFLVPQLTSRYLYFKGWFYSVTIWFLCFTVTKLFKIPYLSSQDINTALSNLIAATIWGLSLAYTMQLLVKRNTV